MANLSLPEDIPKFYFFLILQLKFVVIPNFARSLILNLQMPSEFVKDLKEILVCIGAFKEEFFH